MDNEDIIFSPAFENDHTIFMTKSPAILIRSTDGGDSWQRRDSGLYGFLYEIAISPDFSNDSTLLAINWTGTVFRTTDAGLSWDPIFTYPDYVYYIQFSPFFASDGTIFLGGYKGIYRSTDRGASWEAWNEGFDTPPFVVELACSRSQDSTFYLFAGTYGRGVWVRKCGIQAIEEIQLDRENERSPLSIYPNPFVHTARLEMTGLYNVPLYDVCGRKIRNLKKGTFGEDLKPGIYFVKIQDYKIVKVVKLR
jgi:photosystem II stability/assembly factor-like uncharacterized protein